MFRSTLICRIILVLLGVATGCLSVFITGRRLLYFFIPIVTIWLWLYLSGFKVEITAGYIIRYSGNIFKRKSIIMLKNIFYIQTLSVVSWGPALIKIYGNAETITVIGLDGSQAAKLEYIVKANR